LESAIRSKKMKDFETPEPVDEERKLSRSPITPRTVHKSDPEETPDPEEDEDQTTTMPTKL
jgi:hypothetical protein